MGDWGSNPGSHGCKPNAVNDGVVLLLVIQLALDSRAASPHQAFWHWLTEYLLEYLSLLLMSRDERNRPPKHIQRTTPPVKQVLLTKWSCRHHHNEIRIVPKTPPILLEIYGVAFE